MFAIPFRYRAYGWMLAVVMLGGCTDARPEPGTPVSIRDDAASRFDPAHCGTVKGCVRWTGEIPNPPPFIVPPNSLAGTVLQKKQVRPNPNRPVVDPPGAGVGNAVVFLRGMDARRGRPWDHSPVHVEMRDCEYHIRQGILDTAYGFVRRGDSVRMLSRDPWFHMLHAGGAAFFSLAFPDPDEPLDRVLSENGIVEWTSGAGYYWMRAYTFVDEHPYYTRTDGQGQFELAQVPAGRYDIVCWMPHWIKERHDRDPETGLIVRYVFRPPVSQFLSVTVREGETAVVSFQLAAAMFHAGTKECRE